MAGKESKAWDLTEAKGNRVFESGAIRSSDVEDLAYHLVSPVGLRRTAARYKKGDVNYPRFNYLRGLPASDVINHLIAHLEKYRAGDRTDDHLAAVAWAAFTLMHYEETRPHLMDIETYPLRSVHPDGEKMEYPGKCLNVSES